MLFGGCEKFSDSTKYLCEFEASVLNLETLWDTGNTNDKQHVVHNYTLFLSKVFNTPINEIKPALGLLRGLLCEATFCTAEWGKRRWGKVGH